MFTNLKSINFQRRSMVVWLILPLFMTSNCFASASKRSTYLMGSLGDSITAGFFADIPFGPRSEEGKLTVDSETTSPISGKSAAAAIFESKRSWSWASGQALDSHYVRLRKYLRAQNNQNRLDILNLAVPGNEFFQIKDQVDKLMLHMKSGKYKALLYVTLLIGNNDACHEVRDGTSHDDAAIEALKYLFDSLANLPQKEPIHVLISSLPRIPELATPDVKSAHTIFGLTCEQFRDNMLGSCHSMMTWQTPEEFSARLAVVDHKNQLLEKLAQPFSNSSGKIQTKFSSSVWQTHLQKDQLAIDCFHPSRKGHRMLSESLWNDQPWYH